MIDMRVLTIQRDVKGRAYEELVRLFGGHAAACQLVSHRAPTTLTGKEALSVLSNLDETTAEVSEWCGTRLSSGNKAILHTFPVNEKSLSFLTSHVLSDQHMSSSYRGVVKIFWLLKYTVISINVPGANIGVMAFGDGFWGNAVDFFKPLSDIQDVFDLVEEFMEDKVEEDKYSMCLQ